MHQPFVLRGRALAVLCALSATHVVWATDSQTLAAKPAHHASAAALPEPALVRVEGAWVRATVPGQSGTGGFMQLTSDRTVSLLGFRTEAAKSAELHEMRMEGDMMRMRPVEALKLPAGQSVALRPGGHHLMLTGLKQALKSGDVMPLTLVLRTKDGKTLEQTVQVPVRLAAPLPDGAPESAAKAHAH